MSDVLHVVPRNDLREHICDAGACWCEPKEIEYGLWVHNSLDGREHGEYLRSLH